MQGSNQNKVTKTVTATVAGTKLTFTFDRAFPIKRIKLWSSTALSASQKFRLVAEGENFFGGLDVPVAAVFIKSDDGATTAPYSPAVLTFDTPITCSKQFPLEVTMSGDTATWYVTLEGPSLV